MPFGCFWIWHSSRAGDACHPPRPGCPRHSLDATSKCTPPVNQQRNIWTFLCKLLSRSVDKERLGWTSRRLTMWANLKICFDHFNVFWAVQMTLLSITIHAGCSSKWGWQWNGTGGGWNRGDWFCGGRERGGGEERRLRRRMKERDQKPTVLSTNSECIIQLVRKFKLRLESKSNFNEVKIIHQSWSIMTKICRILTTLIAI